MKRDFLHLGAISGVAHRNGAPVASDFGGGGNQSPIVINDLTGECFIYVNGVITPINTLNVKSFGAKGDGVTDDTAAVTAAAAALAAGSTLWFPAGTYLVRGNITIAASGALVSGANGATVKLANNANNPVFILQASLCQFTGLTIDGNRANNTNPGFNPNAGILVTGNDNYVHGARMQNCAGGGIYSSSTARNRFIGNSFSGNTSPITVVVGSDHVIVGNVCNGDDYGIFIYNNANAGTPSPRNIVSHNVVRNMVGTNGTLAQAAAISLSGAPDSVVEGNILSDNPWSRGIECFAGSSGSVLNGNQCLRNGAQNGSSGIDFGPDDHVVIVGNRCEANGGAGIIISGGRYSIINSNVCRNNAQNAAARAGGGGNGITLNENSGTGTQPVVECIITNNHCIDTQGGGATQQYGIKEWQGLASYYLRNIIAGNNVRTNATGDLSLLSVTDSVYGNVESTNAGGDAAMLSDSAPMFKPYTNTSINLQLTEAHYRVTVDASFGNVTVTLPASPKVSREYVIRRTDASANTVTLSAGALTINGAGTITIATLKGFRVFFNGGSWFTETT